ncbi:MAG: acyltransferase family protein [Weissella confusa]
MSKSRTSNFELLRILAIFLIIIFHTTSVYIVSTPGILLQPINHNVELFGSILAVHSILGKMGNILFAMISGYFLVLAKDQPFFSRAGKTLHKFIPLLFLNGVIVVNGFAIIIALLLC